ncbi:hypothetical protein QJS10_CPA01g02392 [Acorus calamus]|uniref:LysM domain-containing protein n=1 Tax=Acorus calamus TaxID=4465 RepID=A0AAV9FMM5_ACOCL|nr:hypothetical protein QJS10_CPA01g02392 [Acorus calamus]
MRATLPLHHLILFLLLHPTQSQGPPNGYTCSTDRTIYPCRTYAVYRATPPNLLDLAPISDLFGVSRTMISDPSNIAFPNATLVPDQLVLVPLTCSCTSNHSYSNTSYKILPGDTFYILSTTKFQNLTTYQDIELVNPTLDPTNLSIGADVVVPVFCQCPEKSLTSSGVSHLLTYQLRPSDTNASVVASRFRADLRTMVSINARKLVPFSTVLIPVTRIPTLPGTNNSGSSSPTASGGGSGKDGVVVGLSIGLGVVGMVLLVGLLWLLCFFGRRRRRGYGEEGSDVKRRRAGGVGGGGLSMLEENKFMADITDCLDCST